MSIVARQPTNTNHMRIRQGLRGIPGVTCIAILAPSPTSASTKTTIVLELTDGAALPLPSMVRRELGELCNEVMLLASIAKLPRDQAGEVDLVTLRRLLPPDMDDLWAAYSAGLVVL